MLGGGTYISQNKVLPGAYFQFVSKSAATAVLADRGVAAMALELNWGPDNVIFDADMADFQKNSMKIFGYDYTAEELQPIRELLCHAKKLHLYKLTSGGTKAENEFATAVCCGTRGNDLQLVIQKEEDKEDYIVSLYLDTVKVDEQEVKSVQDLVDNDYVTWKKSEGSNLTATASVQFAGGSNKEAEEATHQKFLNIIESYPDTNAVGYMGKNDELKDLYIKFATRMRDEVGIKLQAVVYNKAADNIAVVNVKNDENLVPWVTGVVAGTAVNKSAANMKYDGELTVDAGYTQKELESALKAGEFVLHQVGTGIYVLDDINSFVSVTDEMGEVFKDNQTVRVIDNISASIAAVFTEKYIGKVPNNASGRTSLWSDIVRIHQKLNDMQAIEGFESSDIVVLEGDHKKSVAVNSAITVVNTMTKLYMKTVIA